MAKAVLGVMFQRLKSHSRGRWRCWKEVDEEVKIMNWNWEEEEEEEEEEERRSERVWIGAHWRAWEGTEEGAR